MWWPFQWLVIYVLGGFTCVPLLIAGAICESPYLFVAKLGHADIPDYTLTYGSVPIGDDDPAKFKKEGLQRKAERDEQLELSKNGVAALASVKPLSGWLTVRRQFRPVGTTTFFSTVNTTDLTGAEVEKDVEEADKESAKEKDRSTTPTSNGAANGSANGSSATPAPTTYSARIAQTYRQMMEARQKKDAPPKEYYFCVLKGSVLFLYEDEEQSECVAAIGVDKYVVGVETEDGGRFKGKDAEMFAKRKAVVMRIVEKEQVGGAGTPGVGGAEKGEKKGLPVLAKGMEGEMAKEDASEMENAPWFLFSKSNYRMEDWYLALVHASSAKPNTIDVFATQDMQVLVDTIDTEPDPIPMRWLNAMIGRLFFGVYKTAALEQLIIQRIMKKLSKVPRPTFLSPIVIREVSVGTSVPIFSKPMLKDLTADGTAAFDMHMAYKSRPNQPDSQVRIIIATTATIPTGFKPYVVDLVLAVILKNIEGNMSFQIKRPPSNRVWWGFSQPPKMEVEIVPIVSERKIQIGMVLKAIEKQMRDVVRLPWPVQAG